MMAPSNVFSYLHGMRINQRRNNSPSYPVVPPPEAPSEFTSQDPNTHAYPMPPRLSDNDIRSSTPISPLPPTLPPIPRVALQYEGTEKNEEPQGRDGISSTSAVRWPEVRQIAPIPLQDPRSARSLSSSTSSYGNDDIRNQNVDGTGPANQYGSLFTRRTQLRSATTPVLVRPVQDPMIELPQSSTWRPAEIPPLSRSPQSVLPPAPNARSGKAKLNLLNPMSLLARRRTSQLISQLSSDTSDEKNRVIPGMRLPDDYDPRIRGKVVHDFSAPRQRRYHSSYENTNLATDTSASSTRIPLDVDTARSSSDNYSPETKPDRGQPTFGDSDENRKSGERDHVPVFTEHFGDDLRPWSNGVAALSSERIALTLSNISIAEPAREPPPLPAFARNLPSDVTRTTSYTNNSGESSLLSAVPERPPPEVPAQQSFTVPTPPTSPRKSRSRKSSTTDLSFHSAGLPKHLASTASRFSFDLAGVGSATQEKLLEERHKEKAITRKLGIPGKARHVGNGEENHEDGNDEEDDYMYDDINDDDDIEEKIPGINADAEESYVFNDHDGLQDFQITTTPEVAVKRPFISDLPETETSRVVQGLAGEPAKPKKLLGNVGSQAGPFGDGPLDISKPGATSLTNRSGPSDLNNTHPSTTQDARTSASSGPPSSISIPTLNTDYDDLYYDDGVIAHPEEADTYRFDESVFDDETGPFYGRPGAKLTAPLEEDSSSSASGSPSLSSARDVDGNNAGHITQLRNHQFTDLTRLSVAETSFSAVGQQGAQDAQQQYDKPGLSRTFGLTQDNLAAYHDALAYTTHQATMNGHFAGIEVPGQILDHDLQAPRPPRNGTLHPSETTERSKIHFNPNDDIFPLDTSGEDGDDFDYDDAMEDDPIIAAANAEALENDDEGFYGREFGFYAASSGSGEAQYVHGGYFGPRGPEGLTRSHSGRVNFQEPSLTPITERSEFSNRNSMISLGLYGTSHPVVGPHSAAANGPLPSPGLTQLADLMHLRDDDDLSLSALLKLRRGAWAGSTASLDSSAGSAHSGSPVTYAAATALGGGGAGAGVYGVGTHANFAANSSYSPASSKGNVSVAVSDDGTNSAPSSPTITLQTQGLGISAPAQPLDSSPVRRAAVKGKAGGGHKRNSSGADSVSYVKEKNEWVVEKRRTAADTGLVEVLGREVVVGGRI